ncbi:MAG: aminotransferase class I/II-fold pyridoxal phosphate-dependent enzyme [Lachnospiraceae bacterium]|nr:aminotransferase class I/II-fold pyridoxal phosphate-dependent enzyme [Lachnospiraceae bacterium]
MIFDKLEEYSRSGAYPFHMPGHKRRLAPEHIRETVKLDITEIEGFDDLHDPVGIIMEAEKRAARLYGSEETHFLVNGSTGGILAAIGTFQGQGPLLMARNCHRSVYNAAEINRIQPVYIFPERQNSFGVYGGVSGDEVRTALLKSRDGGEDLPAAVVITSPSYPGAVSDIAGICDAAHSMGVPVIVDEAHGAHLGFSLYFPANAVKSGADIVIQSAHKTLPALTQTALIHINGELVDRKWLRRMLTVYQTSSPSYLLMGSLDACMEMLETEGGELFEKYTARLSAARERLAGLKNLELLGPVDFRAAGTADYDRSKIVLRAAGCRASGRSLAEMLRRRGLEPEMAAEKYVLLMTSIGDSDEGFERLCAAAEEISEELEDVPAETAENCPATIPAETAEDSPARGPGETAKDEQAGASAESSAEGLPAWIAVRKGSEEIPLGEAVGRIAADYIYIYPPGVPLLVPGEIITAKAAEAVRQWLAAGLEPAGVSGTRNDPVVRAVNRSE